MPFRVKNRGKTADRGELELLRSLVRLANELQSSLELDGVVRVIVGAVSETFGFREATVYLVEPDGDTYRPHATVGVDAEYDAVVMSRLPPRRIWDELLLPRFQMGSSFFIDHREFTWTKEQLHYLPALDFGPRREGEWHPDDALYVPLYDKRHEMIGILDLYDPADRQLPTLELVKSLEVFATHAGVAIENARQYEQLAATRGELERQLALRHDIYTLSTALLSSLDQQDVFAQVTTMLKGIVDYDTMDIRLVDEERGELVCIFARDENADQMLGFTSPLDEGVSGWVVQHNEAALVNDMDTDPRAVYVPGTDRGERQASILAPLRVRSRVTGVLCLDRLHGRTFADHEVEPVQLFANLAAIAIQNARSYEEMERQAISDGLTGIHNYRHFHETLKATVSRAERYAETFCLLMMDLDHFKNVNDTIGHQKGDEVLRAVAGVLRDCSRESDYLARYGGEEFVVILPQTSMDEASTMAERIRAEVATIDTGDPGVRVTMSIGVAAFPESATDSDGVLGAADAALLRAKARGRDRVCVYAQDDVRVAEDLEGDLVALGRRFALQLGLRREETAGLMTALAVYEQGGHPSDEVQSILGHAVADDGPSADEVRRNAFEALLYGHERWDGTGYPEGRRGAAIPRVARAFAVCREYHGGNGEGLDRLREEAAHELDPRMVQRFSAMLRAAQAPRG